MIICESGGGGGRGETVTREGGMAEGGEMTAAWLAGTKGMAAARVVDGRGVAQRGCWRAGKWLIRSG